MIYGGGQNHFSWLGIQSDAESDNKYVSRLTEIPGVNVLDIMCIAPGWLHTVIVMRDGSVLAAGKASVADGSGDDINYEVFTKISICTEKIEWAAAGNDYTLYLTKSGRVILCHKGLEGEKIEIPLPKPALSVFGGKFYGGIIDEDGCAYFLDRDDPRKAPTRHEFPSPAVELVCCNRFKAVLLSDHRVFGNGRLNNGQCDFSVIQSLADHEIIKISGYSYSCLALNDDGLVFAYGGNGLGQLGDNSNMNNYDEFTQINIPNGAKAKDIACSFHTLILLREGKLFGCGWNNYNQLFQHTNEENVLGLIRINVTPKLSGVFTGCNYSLAISGINIPENPAKVKFWHPEQNIFQIKFEEQKQISNELKEQVSDLKEKIKQQSEETRNIHQEIEALNQKINSNQEQMSVLINSISDFVLQILSNK